MGGGSFHVSGPSIPLQMEKLDFNFMRYLFYSSDEWVFNCGLLCAVSMVIIIITTLLTTQASLYTIGIKCTQIASTDIII